MPYDFTQLSNEDLKEAIKLARLNTGSLKTEYRYELETRLQGMLAEQESRNRGKEAVR